jgi:hypothetical protein
LAFGCASQCRNVTPRAAELEVAASACATVEACEAEQKRALDVLNEYKCRYAPEDQQDAKRTAVLKVLLAYRARIDDLAMPAVRSEYAQLEAACETAGDSASPPCHDAAVFSFLHLYPNVGKIAMEEVRARCDAGEKKACDIAPQLKRLFDYSMGRPAETTKEARDEAWNRCTLGISVCGGAFLPFEMLLCDRHGREKGREER